jgi:hypothetical protein
MSAKRRVRLANFAFLAKRYPNRGNMMNIIEKSRETVEQLLARRNLPKTYEEKCQYALDLVDMHLHEENPDRIDECIKLYTEDAIWETPARGSSIRLGSPAPKI